VPRVDTAVFRWITALLEDPETILAGYQHAQRLQKERNQEAKLYVDSARRVLDRYESELKDYAEMYTRRLITLNIMAEKKAELDARIKSAQETLEEYEAKVNQDLLSDEEIRDRIIEIKKLRSVIRDIGSLALPQRRRLIKLLNLRFELGMQDNRYYIDIIQNSKEHTNGTRH
jgi:predicted RNase H-like nuclease (RuvC/YqgF family)